MSSYHDANGEVKWVDDQPALSDQTACYPASQSAASDGYPRDVDAGSYSTASYPSSGDRSAQGYTGYGNDPAQDQPSTASQDRTDSTTRDSAAPEPRFISELPPVKQYRGDRTAEYQKATAIRKGFYDRRDTVLDTLGIFVDQSCQKQMTTPTRTNSDALDAIITRFNSKDFTKARSTTRTAVLVSSADGKLELVAENAEQVSARKEAHIKRFTSRTGTKYT